MIKEFINFVREKGVIGLAVGIIVGGAVTQFVNAIINNIVNPVLGTVIGGGKGLASYEYTLPNTSITFGYGGFNFRVYKLFSNTFSNIFTFCKISS